MIRFKPFYFFIFNNFLIYNDFLYLFRIIIMSILLVVQLEYLERKGALRILVEMLESEHIIKVTDIVDRIPDLNIKWVCSILEDLEKLGLVEEKTEEGIPETRIARLTDFGVQIAEKLKYIHDLFYS